MRRVLAPTRCSDRPEGLAEQGAAKDAYKLRSSKGPIMSVDTRAATDRLMRFLAVEGVTGREAAIGREIAAALKDIGVPIDAIRLDDANTRIPVPTETGNLIVDLPGRGAMHNQPRIMFMTHMDTVPLCAGAKPKLAGRKIVNEAKTALGGDNRAGCGVLVTLAAELAKRSIIRRSRFCSAYGRRAGYGVRATSRPAISARRAWPSTTTAALPPTSPSAPSARIAGRSRFSAAPRMPAPHRSAGSVRP